MKIKAYLAEFIATFTLVFIGAGAICLDVTKGGVGLLGIAFAHGLAILVMVAATAHISGAHINPAVTFGAWVGKKISTQNAFGYIVAQLAGASFGAYSLKCFYPSMPAMLGNPVLDASLTYGQGIFAEAVLTFLLVFVIFGSAIDSKSAQNSAPLAIGLVITADILMGGPLTGAAMNPARAFGPALVTQSWVNHGIYWAGPLIGGGLAGLLYSKVFLRGK